MFVLPHHNRILLQITDITVIVILLFLIFPQHPANMTEPKATFGRVRVFIVFIDKFVMHPVIRRPMQRAVL